MHFNLQCHQRWKNALFVTPKFNTFLHKYPFCYHSIFKFSTILRLDYLMVRQRNVVATIGIKDNINSFHKRLFNLLKYSKWFFLNVVFTTTMVKLPLGWTRQLERRMHFCMYLVHLVPPRIACFQHWFNVHACIVQLYVPCCHVRYLGTANTKHPLKQSLWCHLW